jgi:hypothetical protein
LVQRMDPLKRPQSTASDDMNTPPDASGVEMFATWGGLMAGVATILFLAVLLDQKPFETQIIALAADTEYVFFLVFCDSRAWRGYSLRNKTVQQELPRLLGVHCVFVVLIIAALTFALSARSRLPSSWVLESGPKHESPFEFGLIVIGAIAATAQAWVYRRILGRALAVETATTR